MSTILTVILFVFAGAALLVITFGPIIRAASNLDMGWGGWLATWLWTLTWIGLVAGCITLYVQKHPDTGPNACADKGGVWSVTGHHKALVGKVITTVTDYGCVQGPR